MTYPETLILRFPTAEAFAKAAEAHELAPGRKLTRAAVYQWRVRDFVPYMWRPTVTAMIQSFKEGGK
jgi:hypothetical protein